MCPDSLASSIYVIFELTGLKSSAQIWDMKHVPSDVMPSAQWTLLGTSTVSIWGSGTITFTVSG